MARVVFGVLLMMSVLLYQGIYVLRTGQTALFGSKVTREPSRGLRKLTYTLLYLVPAVSAGVILGESLARSGLGPLQSWAAENVDAITIALLFSIVGLLSVGMPEAMMRWTLPGRLELVDNSNVVRLWRVLGFGLVWLGVQMLAGR